MKRILSCILFALISTVLYADDLDIFKAYAQRADSAFKIGDKAHCFQIEKDLIALFNTNRKEYIKNGDICSITFDAFYALVFLDISKNKKEACNNLANGISLITDNPSWVKNYNNKKHIINCFVLIICDFAELGDTISAIKYNEEMISFAEKHYKFELPSVLLSACAMNSIMEEFDRSYPLYQRLYGMFDELDRSQQYEVVKELIRFEGDKGNFSKVVDLALKHEKLIARSKDDIKNAVLSFIGPCFSLNAKTMAKENGELYSESINNAFEIGCQWALRNYPIFFPRICIDYAGWLYWFEEQTPKALIQFALYLDAIEHCNQDQLFDGNNRRIEEAEIALTSIIVQEIISSSSPKDLNSILNMYPKVVAKILEEPNSLFYENFITSLKYAKEKCYGSE